MENTERVEFIAERPTLPGCNSDDIAMPWPSDELIIQIRNERFGNPDDFSEDEQWYSRNGLYNVRDEYFRMRYRGAHWPWNEFNPDEELSEDPETKLSQFLSKGYWAPAVDQALDLYKKTQDQDFRTAAIFACGMHIWDVLDHSWVFLDPKLENDSGVREKHYLIFLTRIADVDELDMDNRERSYFEPLKHQFYLAYAEMAAQNPLSANRNLEVFEWDRQKNEHIDDSGRSSLISFAEVPHELKLRVVNRLRRAAIDAQNDEFSHPSFCMSSLHMFGLADKNKFYPTGHEETPWWRLSAEEILAGDISRLVRTEPTETYEQESLF